MKKVILFLAISLLLLSCRSTKKITETSSVLAKTSVDLVKIDSQLQKKEDKDKIVTEETITTVTKYNAPAAAIGNLTTSQEGSVASRTVTVHRRVETDKGKVEELAKEVTDISSKTTENSKETSFQKETKTPATSWKIWLLGILVVLGALVYWKRDTIRGWIKITFPWTNAFIK